jgi:hypothetical protein
MDPTGPREYPLKRGAVIHLIACGPMQVHHNQELAPGMGQRLALWASAWPHVHSYD